MLVITVTGFRGCERVSARLVCRDERDFVRKVSEWAATNGVTEWSRDNQ